VTLPGDLDSVVIKGEYLDSAGVAQRGRITFTPSAVLTDATGSVVVPMVTRSYLVSGQGTFETDPLVATDNATISPSGWTYLVSLAILGQEPQQWNIALPYSASPVDISGITPAVTQAPTTSALLSTGGNISGTLTLNASPPLRIPAGASAGDVLTSDSSGNAVWGATSSAGLLTPTATKTADYTAVAGDMVKTDTSGGSFTVTLPNAPPVNTTVGVKQIAVAGVGTNATTIAAAGSDVFNKSGGPTSLTLDRLNQTVIMQYGSGGVWTVQSADPAVGQIATARQGVYYLDTFTGTDDAKMASALTAVFAAGGGTIQLSPRAHTFANQWTTSYSSGVTTPLRILGAGAVALDASEPSAGATKVSMSYSGAGVARMDFQHKGLIEISGILFADSGGSSVPFFQTTNAVPNIHDNAFLGSATGTSCFQDAIVLGGYPGSTSGAGDTAQYLGYAGAVYRNYFDGIRRMVLLHPAANSVQIYGNTVSSSCGSNLYLGACIEGMGTVTLGISGCKIYGNCIECSNYPFSIRGTYFQSNLIDGNGFWDPTSVSLGHIYFDPNSLDNTVIEAFSADDSLPTPTVPLLYDLSSNRTTVISPTGDTMTDTKGKTIFGAASFINSNATGPLGYDKYGHAGGWQTGIYTGTYVYLQPYMVAASLVADASIISTSSIITSITANWTSAAINSPVYVGAAYMGNIARIVWAFTPSTAWAWQASHAYAIGSVARPASANGHLYQASTAGTTGASAPTWPTGGGTVTDGTAVWTDLGTSATAIQTTVASNTTASAQNCNWWNPSGATQNGPMFTQNHILSSGSAPTVAVQTAAGSGATASMTGHDMAMSLTLTTGTSPSAGDQAIITFAIAWSATPLVTLTPTNAAAAAMFAAGMYVVKANATLQVWAQSTPASSVAATFDVLAIG
jgi:hypothetical protein